MRVLYPAILLRCRNQWLFVSYKGILPGNARAELKTAACAPWHYHSQLPAARGVLDGLRAFGFIEKVAG